MSSLKSIISSKSGNSTALLPPTGPTQQSATSRKATPEPQLVKTSSTNEFKEKRKRNNSWIANSFRKAFGKEKKKSLDNDDDNSTNESSKKTTKKALSRRACASDDENQLRNGKSSLKHDSDSDFDESYNKRNSTTKSILGSTHFGKRNYRSESELLDGDTELKNKEKIQNANNGINEKKTISFNNYNTIQNFKSCSSILTSTNSTEDSSSTNSRSQKW